MISEKRKKSRVYSPRARVSSFDKSRGLIGRSCWISSTPSQGNPASYFSFYHRCSRRLFVDDLSMTSGFSLSIGICRLEGWKKKHTTPGNDAFFSSLHAKKRADTEEEVLKKVEEQEEENETNERRNYIRGFVFLLLRTRSMLIATHRCQFFATD